MEGVKMRTRALAVLAAVFVASVVVSVVWLSSSQSQQMETQLREKGETLSLQMKATWNFLAENQDRFSTDNDYSITGSYQGLHCAVIGRTIGRLFTNTTDYVTRYVNFNPRNPEDLPDEFEAAGLDLFYAGEAKEYYAFTPEGEGGAQAFRYLVPMEVSSACLKCHGQPAGELDVTGHVMEGWQVGQVGGAISIIMPTQANEAAARQNVAQTVAVLLALMVATFLILFFAWRATNRMLERQAAQLAEANERLRTENEYKNDFLAMISHELRTPLTSIIAFSDMLGETKDALDEKGRTIRREIEANSRVLLLMINDILEMTRVDAGRTTLDYETVDLCDLFNFVEPVVSPIARKNGIAFDVAIDAHVPVIQADFDKLVHVLENLCSNAFKFTDEGGRVQMCAAFDEAADEVLLVVSDTGIGIAPTDHERIFERFAQADSSASRRFNGTGLGLPLAREYVEMHGGTLTVQSELGEGSTFTVRIPREQRER